jgi:hypothetical protein
VESETVGSQRKIRLNVKEVRITACIKAGGSIKVIKTTKTKLELQGGEGIIEGDSSSGDND